ncbi:pyridoxal phosphate-dependent aminotransferase [Aquamicrobium zhengzhouense]|uniref:Aminotransferase n=1 Tax=Aquamicrobium zhengzhouense TaxID=2781738 RepID=A0ABS0S796_9HYPH|nr:pyridoxal phosphate-dependent aminotransferase [Aquamicrobium zhengzhouense]MBI1619152.1 pyridoxal phosphate-dependent aminotransferase [Aquamicrobium zhengzhouense]
MPKLSSRVAGITPSGKDGWEVHFEAMTRKQAGEPIIMLSVGDHDFHTPEATVEACIRELRAGHHHYTQLPGIPRLREAMAEASSACTGVETSSSEILANPGGQAALFAATLAAADPGDHAIIISPYYATYPPTFRSAQVDVSVVDALAEDGFQPRAEAIEAAVKPNTRVILINTPNNPTGAVYSRETLEGIADICRKHDLWLISDEVYWTIAGDREHISPRSLPGMAERTLVVNSMSKSHGMTGWRVGWLTGPESAIETLVSLNLVSTYGLPDFLSRAAIDALENSHGVAKIAARYSSRRTVFLDAVRSMNGISVRGSEGGMYIMLDVSELETDDEAFAWGLLEKEQVAVMPGSSFGQSAAGHIRISLCQPDDLLREAAGRIARFAGTYADQKLERRA